MAWEYRRKMTDASTGDGAFLTSDAPSKPNNKAGWNNNGAQLKRRMLEDDLKKFPRLENETHNFCSPSWIELNYCRYKNVYENAMLPILAENWKPKKACAALNMYVYPTKGAVIGCCADHIPLVMETSTSKDWSTSGRKWSSVNNLTRGWDFEENTFVSHNDPQRILLSATMIPKSGVKCAKWPWSARMIQ